MRADVGRDGHEQPETEDDACCDGRADDHREDGGHMPLFDVGARILERQVVATAGSETARPTT